MPFIKKKTPFSTKIVPDFMDTLYNNFICEAVGKITKTLVGLQSRSRQSIGSNRPCYVYVIRILVYSMSDST